MSAKIADTVLNPRSHPLESRALLWLAVLFFAVSIPLLVFSTHSQLAAGQDSSSFTFMTPEGWKKLPPTGLRRAAFAVGEKDKMAEITALALSAKSGTLLQNVNRWRRQINLEPITEAQLANEIKKIAVAGGSGHYVDLVGEEKRILAVVLNREQDTWYFKMVGPLDLVGQQKAAFETFVKSVKFDKASTPGAADSPSEIAFDGKRLSEWIEGLKAAAPEERRRAAQAIETIVRQSTGAIPGLLSATRTREGELNEPSIATLNRLGPVAVSVLTGALWDEDAAIRLIAAHILGRIGSTARRAIPSLIEKLQDDDSRVRRYAADALGHLEARTAHSALQRLLKDPVTPVRETAVSSLIMNGAEAKDLIPEILGWLKDKDKELRRVGVLTLGELNREAVATVPELVRMLEDESREVRTAAIHSLGAMGPAARDASHALWAILKNDDRSAEHLDAARTLWLVGRPGELIPFLKARLDGGSASDRYKTAWLLWRIERGPESIITMSKLLRIGQEGEKLAILEVLYRIGPAAKEAVKELTSLLIEKNTTFRFHAARALGRIGPPALPATKELTERLRDKESSVRAAAAQALWRIRKDRVAIAPLELLLVNKEADLRGFVVRALGEIALGFPEVIPKLRDRLLDKNAQVRLEAAEELGKINKDPEALRVSVDHLRDQSPDIRAKAATQIGFVFQAEGKTAVPDLIKALWDGDSLVRSTSAEALARIGPAAKKAVPALLTILKTEDQEDATYSAAAEALGQIGPAARAAITALQEKLKHPNGSVRANAALALWHIDRNPAGEAVVVAALGHREQRTRIWAAEAFWHIRKDQRAITTLLDVLREAELDDRPASSNVKYMAIRALGRIGPPAKEAVPLILNLENDEDADMRVTVAEALRRVSPKRHGPK